VSRDAFRRLALIAAATVYVIALGLVWVHVDWLVAALAAILGPLLAAVLAEDWERRFHRPAEPEPEPRRGMGHREISRRARQAAGTPE
jgi:hypothetical protein